MAQVITFVDYVPPARYDGNPWTIVEIEESAAQDGVFTLIDTLAISPVDADPSNPATRSFTTELATEGEGLWYRLIFRDATNDDTLPTTPIQNLIGQDPYATVDEFFRRIKVRNPSGAQAIAARRVLETATLEINAEIDLEDGSSLSGLQLALAAEVNLERAEEHWNAGPFGIIGLGGELGSSFTARDSWERYALKLAPLKEQWGLA